MNEIREQVRERYAQRALTMARPEACCDTACCGESGGANCGEGYSAEELASVGFEASASLGCGNPTLLAELRPGETVLDLGSGAGLDVLLSAKRVSPGGHAYGLDMTEEMLALSRSNQAKAGVANATFLAGTIEQIPLPDASVDVVISNCVINLAADKEVVLREAFRVLRPGGRFAIADMVALEELPAEARRDLDLWAGCVAGTISAGAYLAALLDAGFANVDIAIAGEAARADLPGRIASAYLRATRPGDHAG